MATFLGTRSGFTNSNGNWVSSDIKVYYTVSVDNSSWTESRITFTFTTTGTTKVWNHGVIVNVTCDNSTKPAVIDTSNQQDKSTILVGCKDGWAATKNYVSGGGGSKSISFTITKSTNAKNVSYTVRAYNGYIANYTNSKGQEVNDLRNQGLINSATGSATVGAKITAVGTGTISVTDNYNNTFNVSGTLGDAGLNNPYKYDSSYLWWTQTKLTASDWAWSSSSSVNGNRYTFDNNTTTKSVTNLAINITDTSAETKSVCARVTTTPTYGTATDRYSSAVGIRQYCAPTPSTTLPTLHYNKSRLTVREPWIFEWSAGEAANEKSSPIKGYEICIKQNDTEIPNLSINSSGVITKGTSGGSTRIYWENTAIRQVSFDPVNLGFKAKDRVRFWVRPYTRYGKNNDGDMLPSGWPVHTATVEEIVQNAAVVNKYDGASGKWQEGIACVYKDGSWIEADSVLVYKNGNWVEST